jgi:hypothetical protein
VLLRTALARALELTLLMTRALNIDAAKNGFFEQRDTFEEQMAGEAAQLRLSLAFSKLMSTLIWYDRKMYIEIYTHIYIYRERERERIMIVCCMQEAIVFTNPRSGRILTEKSGIGFGWGPQAQPDGFRLRAR